MKYLKTISFLLLLAFIGVVNAQQQVAPKYEYRAVWLTVIENLDWPKTVASTPQGVENQKQELVAMLDTLQSMNVNTVFLQTRVRGDLIYPSAIEPFSHLFTGVEGVSPGYDPLAFAIEECHKRGMQLHAWLVTMPLGKDEHIAMVGKMSLPQRNRSLCSHYDGAWYMEPGNPSTCDYIVAIVKEVVEKYDVDGVHLDYVRYPDKNKGYPDAALYRKYGKGLSLASWRRSNITRIVKNVYACVKELKPWVRVSCATLGKYDHLTRYSSLGWDAYNVGFQEAQQWARDGIVDMILPMLYFKGNNFYPFVRDWQENSHGRHIIPGIGAYRLLPEYGAWEPLELVRQLCTSRSAGTVGTALFRAEHLTSCAYDVYTTIYRNPALVPPMSWYDTKPQSPSNLYLEQSPCCLKLQWAAVEAVADEPAVRYNVYGAVGDSVDVANPENLLACMLSATSFEWHSMASQSYSFAVTAVDAYGVESEPVRVSHVVENVFVKDIYLPSPENWGMKIEVLDIYGRRLYYGGYVRRVGVRGLQGGYYTLNIYNRHGEFIRSRRFAVGR